jgi:hypothetical protein
MCPNSLCREVAAPDIPFPCFAPRQYITFLKLVAHSIQLKKSTFLDPYTDAVHRINHFGVAVEGIKVIPQLN